MQKAQVLTRHRVLEEQENRGRVGEKASPPRCQKPACWQMCLVLAAAGARRSPGSAEEGWSRGVRGAVLGGLAGTTSLTSASPPGLPSLPPSITLRLF